MISDGNEGDSELSDQGRSGLSVFWGGPGAGKSALLARAIQMLSEARKGGLDNTADFARMGVTPRDRLFLVLRTIWQSPACRPVWNRSRASGRLEAGVDPD